MKLLIASLIPALAPLALASQSVRQAPAYSSLDLVDASAPIGLVPGAHGTGRGTWRGPEEGLGSLRASLVATAPSGVRYAVDAAVARTAPMGPDDLGIHGTVFGPLLVLDPDAGPVEVGYVLGSWEQQADGSGSFLADILVLTAEPEPPFQVAGFLSGSFHTAPPDSVHETWGRIDSRWALFN